MFFVKPSGCAIVTYDAITRHSKPRVFVALWVRALDAVARRELAAGVVCGGPYDLGNGAPDAPRPGNALRTCVLY